MKAIPSGQLPLLALALVIDGCAVKKLPIHLDPALSAGHIRSVALLPVVDARPDRSTKIDLQGGIGDRVRRQLEAKGYAVAMSARFCSDRDCSEEEVREMAVQELSALGAPDTDAVMVVTLEDLYSRYVVMGYAYKIESSAVLVDRRRPRILWRDKGIGSSGQGGLISGLVAPLIRQEAVSGAIDSLMAGFPERPH